MTTPDWMMNEAAQKTAAENLDAAHLLRAINLLERLALVRAWRDEAMLWQVFGGLDEPAAILKTSEGDKDRSFAAPNLARYYFPTYVVLENEAIRRKTAAEQEVAAQRKLELEQFAAQLEQELAKN